MKAKQIARWAVTAVFALGAQLAGAQPGGDFGGDFGGGMPQFPGEGFQPRQQAVKPDNKEAAERMTEGMRRTLDLTDKQYKKVYKLNLSWLDSRSSANESATEAPADGERPMPPTGGPGGGNRGGFGGGERPASQGRPDISESQGKPQGAAMSEPSEEELAARNKKLQKVLTAEQYGKWQQMEADRQSGEHRRQLGDRFEKR